MNEDLTAVAVGKHQHTPCASDPNFIRFKCFTLNPGYKSISNTWEHYKEKDKGHVNPWVDRKDIMHSV